MSAYVLSTRHSEVVLAALVQEVWVWLVMERLGYSLHGWFSCPECVPWGSWDPHESKEQRQCP